MSELTTDLTTIDRAGQVLERQGGHCRAMSTHLEAHGSLHGSLGLVLLALQPLADAALLTGRTVTDTLARVCDTTAYTAGATFTAYVRTDESAFDRLRRLGADLDAGWGGAPPPVGDSPLGPPGASAPESWGSTDSYLWESIGSTQESVTDLIDGARGLLGDVGQWGGAGGPVTEAVDPVSYLVTPVASANVMEDLRWSAGLLLGSVDWVFQELVGYSMLEELIFKPFAGDPRGVEKAAQAWSNVSAALQAVAVNHAHLVSTTVTGWSGAAGDAFRLAMAGISERLMAIAPLFDSVASAMGVVGLLIKGVCAGIGYGIRKLSQMLIEIAAELSVPGVGWGVLLATAYWKVETIFGIVRLVYSLIETLFDAIASFAQAQAQAVASLSIVEDVAEGVFRRAGQASA
ncbi:WXG100 family type VII secretion target [Cellulomonas gilvus]|uniref:WXG100 family type VII secretion target n=1 Tax=Cellulomonas gilvus (strain ATCC 13127 / NRRL B-14078) TaxID=593907 RepID=F8A1T5_CELGA|nr:hypothetical protein [Cellulomonas gilvus]AEI11742.1 hypothetical protein Celgi_1223 [Cellulomonas gilvus ATCC 13127]